MNYFELSVEIKGVFCRIIEQEELEVKPRNIKMIGEQIQTAKSNMMLDQFEVNLTSEILNSNSSSKLSTNFEVTKNSGEEVPNRRKKNKILTLSESRRKLALRADVMNKNFF